MKKICVSLTALFLALSAAAALQGCGGDLEKAQDSVKKGNATIALIEKDSESLGNKLSKAFSALNSDIYANKTPNAAAFDRSASEVKSLAVAMLDRSADAKAEYEKIKELKDVANYKKYADLWIKIIDLNVDGLKQLEAFLDEAKRKLVSSPFDPIAFETFEMNYKDDIDKKGEETGKLQQEAENLKKQKKL